MPIWEALEIAFPFTRSPGHRDLSLCSFVSFVVKGLADG